MSKAEAPWKESVKKRYPSLAEDKTTDVVVIGGGMAGVLSAYLLHKSGKKVILIEKESIGAGITHMTTAFLTQAVDTRLATLRDTKGDEQAKLVWESGAQAIDLFEKIIHDEQIECGFFRRSAFTYINTKDQLEELRQEHEAIRALGFKSTLHEEEGLGFIQSGYLEIPDQAVFEPDKFLNSLAEILKKEGVEIYEETEAESITEDRPSCVRTSKANITTYQVVVTTYAPFYNPIELVAKKGSYQSYAMQALIPRGKIPYAEYWDMENPYHYFRIDKYSDSKDRVIFGGEDHRSEIPLMKEPSQKALLTYFNSIFSGITLEITHMWNGEILEPIDGIAYIGRINGNQYVCTGFSGNGMTYSAISALMFNDLIQGKPNKWERVYDPSRVPTPKELVKKGTEYVQEFIGGAVKNAIGKKTEIDK